VSGFSNRNYQRMSTARGVQAAKDAGCDYVLKWRTDMLPTRLDLEQLVNWANTNVPFGMKSRLVVPAFRNITVEPDFLSSIPDLIAFSHIDTMELIWGDDNFDYSKDFNLPKGLYRELNSSLLLNDNLGSLYCPESEFYAIFRERLKMKLNIDLDHYTICKNYMRLFNHKRLQIFWFGKHSGFRSIEQAWEHPWWTEFIWEQGEPEKIQSGYPVKGYFNNIKAALSTWRCRADELRQIMKWWLIRPSRLRFKNK
jgi:hypothetical protein